MAYTIEDNLDFYELLNSYNLDNEKSNICLISNSELDDNSIELYCGHKFNYLPLYKEVIKQKIKVNNLDCTRLKDNQIKCPYCRTVQNKLLPYFKINGVKKITTVNNPINKTMASNKCQYIFKSGKRKGQICNNLCYSNFCNTHYKQSESSDNKKTLPIPKSSNGKELLKQFLELHSVAAYLPIYFTVVNLRKIAKELKLKNYSKMRKQELVLAIKNNIK